MANLNLPNVRIASDVRFKVKLTDNSVAVDWTSLTGIRAFAYSDAQRIMAGELQVSIDPTDSETLIVNYEDTVPQYQGIVRLVIRGDYDGRQKTFDKPVINFVEFTAQATGVTVITDPVVDVTLAVTEVSTSLLDEAIDACIAATAQAEAAATHGPKIDTTNNHWLVWDAEEGEYVDTGIVAEGQDGEDGPQGPAGPAGPAGTLSYPTFNITAAMHLTATALTQGDVSRFSIADGHLKLTI